MIKRKEFQAIAEAMRARRPYGTSINGLIILTWRGDCRALCAAFEKLNPKFNPDAFLYACGYYSSLEN